MTCKQCGKECSSVRDLDHHRRTDHIVASCELCGRPFYNPAGTHIILYLHLYNLNGIKLFIKKLEILTIQFSFICRSWKAFEKRSSDWTERG